MSTETEALGQMIPPENTLQPGVAVGNNAEATSRAMVGIVTVDLIADADHVLLQTEYVCSVMVISDSGTVLTGPVDIEYPALFPRQTVTNNTAETLTLRMDGTTGITLAAGDTTTIVAGLADVIETGGGGGISDAPSDGTTYGRKDGAWAAVAGGGGSGAPWFLQFKPRDNEPPATNYATLDLRNNRPVLDFDTTTQEAAVFSGVLPAGYGGAGIVVTVFCALTTAVTGTVGWDVAIERTDASGLDIDSDSFGSATTITAVTVPGTSGQVLAMSVNIANGSAMDNIAAGELFRLRLRRDVATDTATGDAELLAVSIKEQ